MTTSRRALLHNLGAPVASEARKRDGKPHGRKANGSLTQALGLRFHINRRTGALLNAVNRGSTAYAEMLQRIAFSIFPIFLEITIASTYLLSSYVWYFGVLTLGIVIVYFTFTFFVTEYRNKFRRWVTETNDYFNQKAADSLTNVETIKYFSAENHMSEVYDDALAKYQTAQIQSQQSLALLNGGQSVIIGAGVTLALYLAAEQVRSGDMTVGDFVLVQQYILQLYQPLAFLGTIYRMIKQSLVDVEAMFQLLQEPIEIQDNPNAVNVDDVTFLPSVEFDRVTFSYDPQASYEPALREVSFYVPPSGSLAIVGKTGAGKSTITRLCYRLYDVQEGSVRVFSQDVRELRKASLRSRIGSRH